MHMWESLSNQPQEQQPQEEQQKIVNLSKKNASRARQRKPAGGDGRNYYRERRCAKNVTGTKR